MRILIDLRAPTLGEDRGPLAETRRPGAQGIQYTACRAGAARGRSPLPARVPPSGLRLCPLLTAPTPPPTPHPRCRRRSVEVSAAAEVPGAARTAHAAAAGRAGAERPRHAAVVADREPGPATAGRWRCRRGSRGRFRRLQRPHQPGGGAGRQPGEVCPQGARRGRGRQAARSDRAHAAADQRPRGAGRHRRSGERSALLSVAVGPPRVRTPAQPSNRGTEFQG